MKLKKIFIKIFKLFLSLPLFVVYINGFYFLMSKVDGISEEQFTNMLSYINTINNYAFIFGLVLAVNFLIWIHKKITEKNERVC